VVLRKKKLPFVKRKNKKNMEEDEKWDWIAHVIYMFVLFFLGFLKYLI